MAKDRRCLDDQSWEVAAMASAGTVTAVYSDREDKGLESRMRSKDSCPVWREGAGNVPHGNSPTLYSTSRPVLRARRGPIPLRYSTGDRLPARGRGEAASRGAQGQAGAAWPGAPRGQAPADRVRAVRHRATSSCRAATPGDLRLPGLHALLRKDQERPVRGQTKDASQAHGEEVEGRPAGPAATDACPCAGAASLARPDPAGSLPVLRRDLQLSSLTRVQGLRRQAMAEGARQAKPERPRELGVLQVDPDRLPTA